MLRVQRAIDGKDLRYSDQAEAWVGHTVAEVLGLQVSVDGKRIKRLLNGWLKSGALVKVSKESQQRKSVPIVEVGEWASE